MIPILVYLWVLVRRWIALAWVRFNRYLVQPSRLEKATPFRHKLIVIGDGYAEGLGDWVQMGSNGGIVRRLQNLAGKDDRIRQYWRVASLGRAGTVTGDWLNVMSGEDDAGLLRKYMNKPSYQDAEIAVVILGAMDVVFQCDQLPLQVRVAPEEGRAWRIGAWLWERGPCRKIKTEPTNATATNHPAIVTSSTPPGAAPLRVRVHLSRGRARRHDQEPHRHLRVPAGEGHARAALRHPPGDPRDEEAPRTHQEAESPDPAVREPPQGGRR
mmetsp:Transcript_36448/g.114259  ORF Transcript_36448/g.114259 Transcript_36448/m.114259 type:complete len:270 (-) Transcript_36448:271-1080(-)